MIWFVQFGDPEELKTEITLSKKYLNLKVMS